MKWFSFFFWCQAHPNFLICLIYVAFISYAAAPVRLGPTPYHFLHTHLHFLLPQSIYIRNGVSFYFGLFFCFQSCADFPPALRSAYPPSAVLSAMVFWLSVAAAFTSYSCDYHYFLACMLFYLFLCALIEYTAFVFHFQDCAYQRFTVFGSILTFGGKPTVTCLSELLVEFCLTRRCG